MNEQIFRKKSLDKIKSPESLNDYIRVSNPSVWLILIALIILLAGACVWGIFGHIKSYAEADMHIMDGKAYCYVSDKDMSKVSKGMTVVCGDVEGTVTGIYSSEGCIAVDIELPDGHYDAQIVIESIEPISFIVN